MSMLRGWMERVRAAVIDARRDPRSLTRQPATLSVGGEDQSVRLLDLSAKGAMIEAELDLAEGTRVVLRLLDREPLGGQVRWSKEGRIGVRFDDPKKRATEFQDQQ